ncbi:MAG: leucyl aminopeptidase, partial [Candidatus Eremiobacteraeota bacterium]|nr:leucyl aminopeptidase [Candidatus Eremiobacteraeota bacterium]
TDGRLEGAGAAVDGELKGALADVLSSGEIKGKLCEMSLLHAKDMNAHRILVVGLGDRDRFQTYMLARYSGAAVRYLGKRNVREIAFALPADMAGREAAAASFICEGAQAATLDTTIYHSEPDKPIQLDAIIILEGELNRAALQEGSQRGQVLGEAINIARRMALTPANDMTPTHMAQRAQDVAERAKLEINVLDEDSMRKEGMGSLLGVSRGSDEPAKMIVLSYKGDPENKQLLALVGKGLTFDSGGISLKPAENMHEMKYDMSGGAGVIAAMFAIGRLKPKINVLGVVPASENLPGPRAMKPGDILRAMNGKTIEVINTDAEGRLILADGLCYANKLGATKIVDAATLTGACVVALGHAASGAMSNNEEFIQEFLRVAEATGERYWQMPLFEDYATAVKSEIADLRNSTGRPAGSLTAGAFLKEFVGDTPWIHLDIAGTAYLENESAWQAKGPTGTPVRAFVSLVEAMANGTLGARNGQAALGQGALS